MRQEALDEDKALALFSLGVKKRETYLIFEKAVLWGKIAEIYENRRQWKPAEVALGNSLAVYCNGISAHASLAENPKARGNLAAIYSGLAHLSSASDPHKSLTYIDKAIGYQDRVDYILDKALYQNQVNDYRDGLQTLRRAIKKNPQRWEVSFAFGHMLTFTGDFGLGYGFYKRALDLARQDITAEGYQSIYLYMAENRRMAGRTALSDKHVQAYLKRASMAEVALLFRKHTTNWPGRYPFVHTGIMLKQVQEGMCHLADMMVEKAVCLAPGDG